MIDLSNFFLSKYIDQSRGSSQIRSVFMSEEVRVFGFPEYANLKVTNNPRQGFSVIVDLPVDLHLVLLVWLVFEVVGEGGIRSKL